MEKEKLTGQGSKPRLKELQCKPRVGMKECRASHLMGNVSFKLKSRWRWEEAFLKSEGRNHSLRGNKLATWLLMKRGDLA